MPDNSKLIKDEVYDYLNALRESGITNMFGATPYIVDAFEIDKKEAKQWLSEWQKDFNPDN